MVVSMVVGPISGSRETSGNKVVVYLKGCTLLSLSVDVIAIDNIDDDDDLLCNIVVVIPEMD